MLDQRGRLLVAALGFVGLHDAPADPALDRLRPWLDSWPGIGEGRDHVLSRAVMTRWRRMETLSTCASVVQQRRVGSTTIW